jgi:glypican 4 (K-glypican)
MAVIYRGQSIRMRQGIVLVLMLVGASAGPQQGCDQARRDVEDAGLPAAWLQDRPAGGEICGENSCCSRKAEQEMVVESKRQIETFLRDSISKVSSLIDVRARKFDALFREMMNNSKAEFHDMFQKTYGKIYLQNSDVFSDFFKELELYYKKGSTRLSDTLEAFFVVLYQRMFTVLNSQYSFDEKYLECVSDHMKDVRPFDDVPHKFTLQLKRSFVATRTYYKALSTAAEAARRLMNVRIDKECETELVNMRYCGSCSGLRGMGTCSTYCTAVLQACLRHHTAFSSEWDHFIEALDKVADRLVGPYNIEIVVQPLNIKISEAIMNFQESGTEVSNKIYTLCGKPTLNRRKRRADGKDAVEENPSYEIKYTPMKKMNGHKKKKTKKYEEEDEGPTLERLIKEIKMKVRDTRQFWEHLPYQYCNNMSAPVSSGGKCWNGTDLGEYRANSTVKASTTRSPVVSEQAYVLQMFTDKLRKAYQGEEVEIIDDSEDSLDGSGSGSGDFEIVDTSEQSEIVPKVADDFESANEIPEAQPPPSSAKPDVGRTHSGGASTMPLSKAVVQYLLPIALVWFGGAISDLL